MIPALKNQKIYNYKFAITISPPPRLAYTKNKNQYKNLYMDDKLFIKNIMSYIKVPTYLLYPEFDDKQRLHYHGIINMNYTQYVRYMKWAQFKIPKLGFTMLKPIKTLNDNLEWIVYMSKNWNITKQILEISRPLMRCTQMVKEASPTEMSAEEKVDKVKINL